MSDIAQAWAERGWGSVAGSDPAPAGAGLSPAPARPTYKYIRPLSEAANDLIDVMSHKGDRYYLGLPEIDALTRGFGPKELVLIVGIAHSGKTQVLLNSILHNLDRRILFFSIDDSREMVLTNLVCMSEGISAEQVEKEIRGEEKHASGGYWQDCIRDYARDDFKNLSIVDESVTLDDMTEAVHEATDLWGAPPQAVFVDYLQSLRLEGASGEEYAATAGKAFALKRWVKDKPFPTLVIHQGTKTGSPPGAPLNILSGAYAGHDTATFLLGVRRKRDFKDLEQFERDRHQNTVTLHVMKNKRPPSRVTGPEGKDFLMKPETGFIRSLRADGSDLLSPADVSVDRAEVAIVQSELTEQWTDREPQPSDGPEYHADHAAWQRRHP